MCLWSLVAAAAVIALITNIQPGVAVAAASKTSLMYPSVGMLPSPVAAAVLVALYLQDGVAAAAVLHLEIYHALAAAAVATRSIMVMADQAAVVVAQVLATMEADQAVPVYQVRAIEAGTDTGMPQLIILAAAVVQGVPVGTRHLHPMAQRGLHEPYGGQHIQEGVGLQVPTRHDQQIQGMGD